MTAMYKEYAEALFMLSRERGKEEELSLGLDTVTAAFDENPEYSDFLACPSVPYTERAKAIEAAFGEVAPEEVVSLVCLLCERGRIRELFDCVKEYKRLLDFHRNTKTAVVRSSVALNEEEKARLQKKLEKKYSSTVTLECILDPSLLGGLVIEIDGKIIDGSVRTRLEQVKGVIGR